MTLQSLIVLIVLASTIDSLGLVNDEHNEYNLACDITLMFSIFFLNKQASKFCEAQVLYMEQSTISVSVCFNKRETLNAYG